MHPFTTGIPIGTQVRYHGSNATAHGDTWRYDGFCRCNHCQHQGGRYRLKTTEHRADGHTTLRHVHRNSFTVLDTDNQEATS